MRYSAYCDAVHKHCTYSPVEGGVAGVLRLLEGGVTVDPGIPPPLSCPSFSLGTINEVST